MNDGADVAVRVAELARRLTGRAVAGVEPVAPGLGARRFFRIRFASGAPPTAMARVEPEVPVARGGVALEPPLEPIRDRLERAGLPVPARYGGDPGAGVELLEDVGDESLERAVAGAGGPVRRTLYRAAVDLVPRLQAVRPDAPGIAAFERRLDAALLRTKARKWLEWTVPVALGRAASPAESEATGRAFAVAIRACEQAPSRLAHRDYKAANIHVRPRREASRAPRLVLIDLQGAFMAPPEYDLVCLLRDSHVRLPEDEVRTHLAHVRPALPDAPGSEEFDRRFDLLTLVRVAKDVSHYVDAATTRGDLRYLRFVPTGLHNLRAAADRARRRDPAVGDFADHLAAIPDDFADPARLRPNGGPACAP